MTTMTVALDRNLFLTSTIYSIYYGPGDAIARVSRSSMVALHTLLSCVLHACGLMKCQMQFFAVLSDHVDPSFLLPSPLSGSMYIAVVGLCYFGVSFVLHPIPMSKVSYRRLFRILSIIPSLMSSLLNISSFLILSLLVILSIFRMHAISNTLSLCFCFSLSVHVSAFYSRVLSTKHLVHACFCGLAQFLGVPHLPKRLPSSPRQPNSSCG